MLFNKKKIIDIGMFDKKIFLYLEDIDLCKRLKMAKEKIYISRFSKVSHLGANHQLLALNMRNVDIVIGCGQRFILKKSFQIFFMFILNFSLY